MDELITKGQVDELAKLLDSKKEIDINKPMYGSEYFALRYAVEREQIEVLKLLLSRGADANVGSPDNYWPNVQPPPLMSAAEMGNVEITKLLIDHGANPFHEMTGRKAKTRAKGKECTDLCRAAEAAWKAKAPASAVGG